MPTTTTAPDAPAFPGVSRLICVADRTYPRYSEADVTVLPDGRLLLAVARKNGASDFAAGELIGFFSRDRGLTWDDKPHVIRPTFDDVGDLMSVSFCRSGRGLHLFFLGRGPKAAADTRVYQMLSVDDGRTWSKPERVSARPGYHIVNNARVVRTAAGRILVPCAYVDGDIHKLYKQQRLFCYYSDDDGVTWRQSNDLAAEGQPLMEPGVAECADGSVYMTIRTQAKRLWEARSADGGATWKDLRATALPAPAAPSTVVRAPGGSDDLWLFWCDRPDANWKGRSRQVFASSKDHGRTWSAPRPIEDDPRHSYGYTSVTVVPGGHALLTYYDWADAGQRDFQMTHLRQRTIPLAWFRGEPVPPVFRTTGKPVLTADRPWEGRIVSMNSGLLAAPDGRWRLWYTNGALGPKGETLRVCYAESVDRGLTWRKPEWPDAPVAGSNVVSFGEDGGGGGGSRANFYHASVHAGDRGVTAYVWRRGGGAGDSALYRYVSSDDGRTFARDPDRALVASHNASRAVKEQAGEGRISNDAFDVLANRAGDGTWTYFAAVVEKATDPGAIIPHDNAAGHVRLIARATSRADGVSFSPTDVVIRPDPALGDAADTQFYGMQVFRYRGFYLGLLQTFCADSQVIQPEWAWSHDGINWARTRTPCVPLGDEGAFDSRMILFGRVVVTGAELVWLYSGYDWRHNAFRRGEVSSSIGRATLPRAELDAWLDTLPEP